jgi:GTP diphosphokinase / guanosine-3',5'-bis(diphosphate) 3'-diphosphatase
MPVVFRDKLDDLLLKAGEYMDFDGLELVRRAYEFTVESNRRFEFLRMSGEPAISHPLAVASQLTEWRMDPETVAAGILHDIIEDPNIHAVQLRATFGDTVTRMVDGVSKLKKFEIPSTTTADTAYHYKIFLAVAQDTRVALIKIADRLHNLRTLESMPGYKRLKTCYETEQIFIPLSRFLGMEAVAEEMEDISFQFSEPEEFARLLDLLEDIIPEEDEIFNQAIEQLEPALRELDIEHQSQIFRYNLTQTHRIMNSQDRPMPRTGLIEVTVPEELDCYRALQAVHKTFQCLSIGFQDTINFPSIDLKRMLETSLLGPFGRPFTVRIFSREMKTVNRWGIVPYLSTPHELKRTDLLADRVELIQRIVKDFREQAGDRDEKTLVDIMTRMVLKQKIFVFTQDRRRLELPEASTVLDFAYLMGPEIGNRFSKAMVYHQAVDMSYQPQLFDHLNVITDREAAPHVEWLEHAHTLEAQRQIKKYLATAPRDKAIEEGRKAILRRTREEGITTSDKIEDIEQLLPPVLLFLGINDFDEFYAQIGYAEFELNVAIDFLKEQFKRIVLIDKKELEPVIIGQQIFQTALPIGIIESERPPRPPLFSCEMCSPAPGDEIVLGTASKKSVIHRKDCAFISRGFLRGLKQSPVLWKDTGGRLFPVRIKIKLFPAKDIHQRILKMIGKSGAPIAAYQTGAADEGGLELMEFLIEVQNEAQAQNVCDELLAIKDVVIAKRV